MAAEEGNNIIRGIYTGEEELEYHRDWYGDVLDFILFHVTHLSVHDSITSIPSLLFYHHPNIVELICHHGIKTIEEEAFKTCHSLERVIMPGVEEVEGNAFDACESIKHVECQKLEIIRAEAFDSCTSLGSIDLPSARIVEENAFDGCTSLRDVKFGKNLERLGAATFLTCFGLERVTIPLKSDLIEDDDVFTECLHLKRVDLVEETVLHETVTALLMEEWRQDMSNVIDSINHILPNTPAGQRYNFYGDTEVGGKARAIREWVALVLRKIILYKAQHHRILNEAATILKLDLPNDIVHNNVLDFLELPSQRFDGEGDGSMV